MDGVALITVNDPDRRNAVTTEISSGLRAAIDAAEGDPKVYAVVATGAAASSRVACSRSGRKTLYISSLVECRTAQVGGTFTTEVLGAQTYRTCTFTLADDTHHIWYSDGVFTGSD
jgi:hypothetical protein